jgi:hypothetical protein
MPHAYSFKDVRVTFKSPYGDVRLGMADQGGGIGVADEGLSFEKAEERNTMQVGVNGIPIHFLHSSTAGIVRIRLLKTSKANGQLMDLFKRLRNSGDRWADNSLSLEDKVRGDKVVVSEVAFSGEPTLVFGKAGGMNEWTFHAGVMEGTLSKDSGESEVINV